MGIEMDYLAIILFFAAIIGWSVILVLITSWMKKKNASKGKVLLVTFLLMFLGIGAFIGVSAYTAMSNGTEKIVINNTSSDKAIVATIDGKDFTVQPRSKKQALVHEGILNASVRYEDGKEIIINEISIDTTKAGAYILNPFKNTYYTFTVYYEPYMIEKSVYKFRPYKPSVMKGDKYVAADGSFAFEIDGLWFEGNIQYLSDNVLIRINGEEHLNKLPSTISSSQGDNYIMKKKIISDSEFLEQNTDFDLDTVPKSAY